jgi:hypothetical protein
VATYNLSWYQLATQRLLHDVSGAFYTTAQLTDWVNQARVQTAQDSNCVRVLQPFTFSTPNELYPYSALPQGPLTLAVLGINVIWGSLKYPLRGPVSFSFLSSRTRTLIGWVQQPALFANYGNTAFYVGPPPDSNYVAEIDTSIIPNDLVSDNTVEQIPPMWSPCVPYYAAFLAKEYQQMWQESAKFEDDYQRRLIRVQRAVYPRGIGNIYTANT